MKVRPEALRPDRNLSKLKCMDCGHITALYGATDFGCPHCSGLYDVVHNHTKALAVMTIPQWKALFDARALPWSGGGPEKNSGIWRFREIFMPSLAADEIVSLGEGIVPFWRAGKHLSEWIGGELDLHIIPKGLNPTGSFKDDGMTVMMSVAKASGIEEVGCASTGDTVGSMAAYAAAAGIQGVGVVAHDVTSVQISQPLAHGSKLVRLTSGSFDDASRMVFKLAEQGLLFPANSKNPNRIEGHQATVFLTAQYGAWELPDWFVVPAGNGSNSSSIGKGMRLLRDLNFVGETSQLLAVQAEAANPLARSWEAVQENNVADPTKWLKAYEPQAVLDKTTATAMNIGNPVSYKKVMREITASRGAVLSASEADLNYAVMVAGADGFSVCPQTGAALAGLRQAVARGIVKPGTRVVLVSTATGLKFPNVPAEYGKHNFIDVDTNDIGRVAEALGL